MFDLAALRTATQTHGTVARIVVASHDGSAPRETGTSMLVWQTGQSGTIGGGALEHQATQAARALLQTGGKTLSRIPLGPTLGQCCGGAVTLVTEVYTTLTLPPEAPLIARPVAPPSGTTLKVMPIAERLPAAPEPPPSTPPKATAKAKPSLPAPVSPTLMPLAVKRLLSNARTQGQTPPTQLLQGWLIEPLSRPTRHLWIWGAGHVGRALIATLSPLPDLHVTWIDVAQDRFPDHIPSNVTALPAANPVAAVHLAPPDAHHLILTFSHSLDLDLCHALLTHGFQTCGLIGSATKWARFRNRLKALGHPPQKIAQITCPIGDPGLGKHPQAIAIGVTAAFLRDEVKISSKLAKAEKT